MSEAIHVTWSWICTKDETIITEAKISMAENEKQSTEDGKQAGEVGYGNPPMETRFKPGNKASHGRKKGTRNWATILRAIGDSPAEKALTPAKIAELEAAGFSIAGKSMREISAACAYIRSLKTDDSGGSIGNNAMRNISDREDGQPVATVRNVDLTGSELEAYELLKDQATVEEEPQEEIELADVLTPEDE